MSYALIFRVSAPEIAEPYSTSGIVFGGADILSNNYSRGQGIIIFDGEVTQCFSVPGSNQSVIVKHGNYRTVYSNLVTLYVKVGDKVSTKQKIGKVYTDTENDNKTELYFMLYKDTEIQNPENWLAN